MKVVGLVVKGSNSGLIVTVVDHDENSVLACSYIDLSISGSTRNYARKYFRYPVSVVKLFDTKEEAEAVWKKCKCMA